MNTPRLIRGKSKKSLKPPNHPLWLVFLNMFPNRNEKCQSPNIQVDHKRIQKVKIQATANVISPLYRGGSPFPQKLANAPQGGSVSSLLVGPLPLAPFLLHIITCNPCNPVDYATCTLLPSRFGGQKHRGFVLEYQPKQSWKWTMADLPFGDSTHFPNYHLSLLCLWEEE